MTAESNNNKKILLVFCMSRVHFIIFFPGNSSVLCFTKEVGHFFFNWSLVDLQFKFCCTAKWLSYNMYVYVLFHGLFYYGLSQNPPWLIGKELAWNVGDAGSIPSLGRSPGEGNGNPFSILAWEIPRTEESGRLPSMGLWKRWTWLSH